MRKLARTHRGQRPFRPTREERRIHFENLTPAAQKRLEWPLRGYLGLHKSLINSMYSILQVDPPMISGKRLIRYLRRIPAWQSAILQQISQGLEIEWSGRRAVARSVAPASILDVFARFARLFLRNAESVS
ncbi:MAG: hypothetical protein JO216_07540 [Hyphomicrobiales bacterium]|nr:hypothetical protein [Hyphomicrobiales bacterium]